jgi:hypothetical protein
MQPLLQWRTESITQPECMHWSVSYPAGNVRAPYFHLWPTPLYNIFSRYLVDGTFFREEKY